MNATGAQALRPESMSLLTKTSPAEILKDNLEHTIFSWSKQSGPRPFPLPVPAWS